MNETSIIIESLEHAPTLIVPLVREIPAQYLKRRPGPNKWSAHEQACHLANVHPLFFSRLDLMLSQNHPCIVPYIPDLDDPDDLLLKMDLDESLERFQRDRKQLVARLKTLSPRDWARTAEHGEYNRYSVRIMFRHLAMHDHFHAYRIEEIALKKDWK